MAGVFSAEKWAKTPSGLSPGDQHTTEFGSECISLGGVIADYFMFFFFSAVNFIKVFIKGQEDRPTVRV